MSARAKFSVVILVLVAVVMATLLLLLPRLANIDQFRPRIIANLERQTGRSVDIGRLSLAILPKFSIRADDVAVGNPRDFPQGPFLEIRKIYFDLDFRSALQRRLVIKSLELDQPVVSLLTNSSGHWNTESPRPPTVRPAVWQEGPATPAAIAEVQINHGHVTCAVVSGSGQLLPISFDAQDVSAELHDVNPQGLGWNLNPVRLTQFGSNRGGWAGAASSPPASLQVLQISWTQPSAVEGEAAASPQGPLVARGTLSAQSARFGDVETTGFKSAVQLYDGGVHLDALDMALFGGRVTGDFVWNSRARPSQYAARLALSGIDTARLLLAFPNAPGKLTGTLEGHLDLRGSTPPAAATVPGNPLADTDGTGDLTIRNGTLPMLRVNADMRQLLKNIVRTGSPSADPSSFRSISADLEINGGEIRSRQITILGNGIEMDVTGSLALGGSGRLDYQGVGKIDTQRNGYSSVLAGILGSKISGGKITFPFTLTGTLESPHFGIKSSPWFH